MIKPIGKTMAEIVRMRPGALVWNQGEEFVDSDNAQPKESNAPPIKELINILSIPMRAFFAPIRDTSSVVCAGVKASIVAKNGGRRSRRRTEIIKCWRRERVTVRPVVGSKRRKTRGMQCRHWYLFECEKGPCKPIFGLFYHKSLFWVDFGWGTTQLFPEDSSSEGSEISVASG